MCILAELFYEWHSPRETPQNGDRAEWDRNEDLWTQAEKVLDAELFDELKRSVIDLMDLEACREFKEGFRLGAQLMLELYADGAPEPPRPAIHRPNSTASAPVRCPTPTL